MERRAGQSGEPSRQDEALQRLEAAVAAITDSDSFRRWLDVSARFHTYSLGNQLLIALQRPDATRVAGFHTWKKLGRFVKKGETGIRIFVPHVRKATNEAGEEERVVTSFGTGVVFDVSQTDGDPLPEHEVPLLEGDEGGELWSGLSGFAAREGVSVEVRPLEDLPEGVMGYYSPLEKQIVVAENPQRQMTKTLAHELGHHVARFDDRAENECIAEGIAYVVCGHFGLDTGERSFPYVAAWAADKERLRGVLGTIQSASATIISGVTQSQPFQPETH